MTPHASNELTLPPQARHSVSSFVLGPTSAWRTAQSSVVSFGVQQTLGRKMFPVAHSWTALRTASTSPLTSSQQCYCFVPAGPSFKSRRPLPGQRLVNLSLAYSPYGECCDIKLIFKKAKTSSTSDHPTTGSCVGKVRRCQRRPVITSGSGGTVPLTLNTGAKSLSASQHAVLCRGQMPPVLTG